MNFGSRKLQQPKDFKDKGFMVGPLAMALLLVLVLLCVGLAPHARGLACSPMYSLGVDFGTSGVRYCLVDEQRVIHDEQDLKWDASLKGGCATSWTTALQTLMQQLPTDKRASIQRICISGTSATALLARGGAPSRAPLMYNYNVLSTDLPADLQAAGQEAVRRIRNACPPGSAAAAPTSTLAKLLTWQLLAPLERDECLVHQADFVASWLL
ncbi:hypothetical protein B484DRAFT_425238, partial [Ochromonadaceae sp. CCMP2298]